MEGKAEPEHVNSTLHWSTWLIGFVVLLVDQTTKYFSYAFLSGKSGFSPVFPYGGIGLFQDFLGIDFSLNYMTNTGAAWGFLGQYQVLLMGFRILLIGGLILYFLRFNKESNLQIPLMLIISGAIGNVVDYFVYGHVIDMFHFVLGGYDFPVFNFADTAITCGVILIAILSLFS